MTALKTLIESRRFELAITVLIVINAITLGLETSADAMGLSDALKNCATGAG